MKTPVEMKRVLFDSKIRQHSQTGYFSANDLVTAGNRFRTLNRLPIVKLQDYLNKPATKEFISQLEKNIGDKAKKAQRGRYATTWIHPYLFIDLALLISPELKIEVYSWLFDELIRYRNDSGDSYKKMAGALWENCSNKSKFHEGIRTTAKMIKISIGVKDWESATEDQLRLRDKIHENIALLCDVLRDNNQAVKLGINKTIGNQVINFK
jgi:hypothetical protein